MKKLDYVLRGCVRIHFPLGLFNAVLISVNPWAGFAFALGFVGYEQLQDKVEHDRSYLDVYGWLWGLAAGGITLWILEKFGIGF